MFPIYTMRNYLALFSCTSHHIPQIFYRVTILELLHRKSQLFTIERLSVCLVVSITKICGKFTVNFTRRYIIDFRNVINSQ